ncbi:hypothetical protein [Nevskia ramosa]|uniref:hypothetical protein n=1 Tax=Nevskia ramosa TaxID=64002 RepID=UPI003D0DDA1A
MKVESNGVVFGREPVVGRIEFGSGLRMREGEPITEIAVGIDPALHNALREAHACLLRELKHLVGLLEPMEQAGTLDVPGLATLNGARKAIETAEAVQ